jgi:hypothetical protein
MTVKDELYDLVDEFDENAARGDASRNEDE